MKHPQYSTIPYVFFVILGQKHTKQWESYCPPFYSLCVKLDHFPFIHFDYWVHINFCGYVELLQAALYETRKRFKCIRVYWDGEWSWPFLFAILSWRCCCWINNNKQDGTNENFVATAVVTVEEKKHDGVDKTKENEMKSV